MDLAAAGLSEQPFRTHGRPLVTIRYASYIAAYDALTDMLDCRHGLVLLQGPPLSGKTTITRDFADSLSGECAVAVIDGRGLNTTGLLSSMLRQYGYEIDSNSTSELLAMVKVFCLQQTASHKPPVLLLENAHDLNPSALRALCELAELNVRQNNALKMVLLSSQSLRSMIEAPAMECIAKRISKNVHIRPMSSEDARTYIHSKLRAAGSQDPEQVFPSAICTELWQSSGGWPGILDRVALLALAKSESLPVSVTSVERPSLPAGTWDDKAQDSSTEEGEQPRPSKLIISCQGQMLSEIDFDRSRVLIGRSDHNDISINSKFVSRHHLLLVRHGKTTFMMDLNSTNGTYVNSRRVSNHVLIDGDVLSVGNHRIKFVDPDATTRGVVEGVDFADTAIMKSLEDMRSLLAQENTEMLPAANSENLPTYVP